MKHHYLSGTFHPINALRQNLFQMNSAYFCVWILPNIIDSNYLNPISVRKSDNRLDMSIIIFPVSSLLSSDVGDAWGLFEHFHKRFILKLFWCIILNGVCTKIWIFCYKTRWRLTVRISFKIPVKASKCPNCPMCPSSYSKDLRVSNT